MIKILDCTLRDGGYVNNWKFLDTQIYSVINSLEKSNIDIIECGYLNDKKSGEINTTLFNSTKIVDKFITQKSDTQKVVMINFGDFDIKNLPLQKNSKLHGIRLAFHKKDIPEAIKASKVIIKLGYKVFFQAMVTKNYSDLEFLSLIKDIKDLDIYAFYIVDSFGSMTLEEFQRYIMLADNNLNHNIAIGYHSHNNMQLAFSNAIDMCNLEVKRDIIIDSSIYGVGRGAGNLNTELIANYLNTTFSKSYDILPLLEIIDELLNSMMKKNSWGFSPAQFLSASCNCHPNYASYLVNKNTNHMVGIKKVLDKLPLEKKASFDKDLAEKIYMEYLLENRTPIKEDFKLDISKNILLIASGTTVEKYKNIIKDKKSKDYTLIALNHKPTFECDYYFFSNQKRFDKSNDLVSSKKIIITSNILTNLDTLSVLNFSKLVFTNNKFIKNVAIVSINHLILQGFDKVEIIGLDGYKVNDKNYHYEETTVIQGNDELLIENELIKEALSKLESKIVIEFLTPSEFKKNMSLRILGVIPARYKSSRFEGKPLCMIKNIPMIKRTYTQASKSKLLTKLIVATDSDIIEKYCKSEKIPVVMTSEDCLTGTDRIAEIATKEYYDLYVNIQGDEPVIDPVSIDEIVEEFKTHGDKYVAYNLYKNIDTKNTNEVEENTIIKTIVNEKDELMYMSRLGIPFNKSNIKPNFKKQVCVYGFTKNALELFSNKGKASNELHEDIEILRFLDMGYKVKMRETQVDSIAVDTPEDVKKVEQFLKTKGLV